MKRLAILVMVLALVFPGCVGFGKWSSESQQVVDFVCNPTDAQKAEAAQYLAALNAVQGVAAMFYPPLAIAQASAVMTTVAAGSCFLLSQVQAALDLLQAAQAKQAMAKGFKMTLPSAAQQFPALWAATHKGK